MSVFIQDVRYAVRSLLRAPGFSVVALTTLALGIGGTTAIFSVVDGILLRPLPYPEPEAIVSVSRISPSGRRNESFAAADYLDYKRETKSFTALAGYRSDIVDMTGGVEPIRLQTLETTAGFFDVIGLPPLMGRVYTEATDPPGGPRVVVIAERMWRQHLGADPDVIGRTVRLNGVPFTVIGVMPDRLEHPDRADVWTLAPREVPTSPLPIEGDPLASREVDYFQVLGRLAPGVSLEQANQDLASVGERLAREFADTNRGERAEARSYHSVLVGDVRTALWVLLGAVGFVLLIACANVANLLLARGTARRREFALRSALGARSGRLVRQLLTESLLLATLGGVLGLLVAFWGVSALVSLAPETIPRLNEVQVDPRVAAFAVAASLLVGVLFGLVPALQGSRPELVEALKEGGRSGTARISAQKLLVVAEVALALVLLIGAGLMLTSFARLRAVDVGFTVDNLVVVFVPLPQARYSNEAQARFYTDLQERLRAHPVTAASALVFPTPFGGANARGGYRIEGRPEATGDQPIAQISSVTPGYFEVMGIPILRGRDIRPEDNGPGPRVALINQAFAEREWPDVDPIGRRFSMGGDPDRDPDAWLTVIGVVGNSKRASLEGDVEPAAYLPLRTFTLPFMGAVVRSEASEGAITSAVREVVRSMDPELPVENAETLERILQRTTGQPRFRALLVTAFAGMALLLASVGLYGLISYTVAQRVPEIGVRMALGATPLEVGALVVRQGLVLAVVGVVVGVLGALATARVLQRLLFSVSATDPLVYTGLAALLLGIAALACYVPARRAMRIDPIAALRTE